MAVLEKIVAEMLPEFGQFLEQAVKDSDGKVVGWSSHLQLQDLALVGSGTHPDRLIARRIALAESLERKVFDLLNSDPSLRSEFFLDEVRSSSGFAGGFNDAKTQIRSIAEGLERWAWSQWIDRHYFMQEVTPGNDDFSELAMSFISKFDSVRFFKKEIAVPVAGQPTINLNFGVVLGYFGSGVFAGSRVTGSSDDLWTHGLTEAFRHKELFETKRNEPVGPNDWFMGRVVTFGNSSQLAETQIELAHRNDWPKPRVALSKQAYSESGFYVWRSLFNDYVPWHLGDHNRFIY